jgi:tetratricopeptide (TPR) repeat protein
MRDCSSAVSFLLSLLLLLFSPSCSAIYKITGWETKAVDTVVKEAQAYIALGEYPKALKAYSDAYKKYPHNAELQESYARAGEQLKSIAYAAFEKKDFPAAGSIFNVLLASDITGKDLAESLSFDCGYLSKQIKICSEALMESGLIKYREGSLDDAVSLWKKALTFDPENRDVKKAIDKATVQLQKMKKIK